MLNDKLRSKNYYLSKLTLFLRNSYGIEEQVDLYWNILNVMLESIDSVFEALSLEQEIDVDHTLDILAEIVGCKRNLDVEYYDNATLVKETLFLNNRELIRSIRTRIIQNNYFGGQDQLSENYSNLGLNVLSLDSQSGAGIVSQILDDDESLTANDKAMFLSGNYTIKSVGIIYEYSIGDINMYGIWDNINSKWGVSQWGE